MSESDYDCPLCGGPMRLRTGRFGDFYGCRSFPACDGLRQEDGTPKAGSVRKLVVKKPPAPPVEEAPELETVDLPPPVPLPDPTPGDPINPSALPSRPSFLVLDEHQEAVVAFREGVAVVAAGAGSGKSTVLIERTASLLLDGILPEHICTLVYNSAAAKDFKARLVERVGVDVAGRLQTSTFHGWAYQILRRWDPRNPAYQKDRIIGTDDGPSGYQIAGSVTKRLGFQGEVDPYLRASEQIREALIDLESTAALDQIVQMRVSGHSISIAERLLLFTREYQAEKRSRNAIDFADMLYKVGMEIRKGNAERLKMLYQHVQVDEGQDINVARLLIAKHLGYEAKTLVVVGDLRQSCYGFTGARPDLFKGLLDHGAKLMTLPINRRSTVAIVAAGNNVAAGRDWNLGGACSPRPGVEEGEPIRLWPEADSPSTESSMVAAEAITRIEAGLPLADESGRASYVCLVRTNAQAAGLEAALTNRGVPVRVLGTSGGVWATTLGREFRAYLAATENLATDDLTKISNKPVRFIKGDVIREVITWVKHGQVTLVEALRSMARQKSQWKPERHGAWELANDLEVLASAGWGERCHAVAQFLCMDLMQRAQQDSTSEVVGQVSKPDEDKEAMYKALAVTATRLGSLDAIEAQIRKVKKDEDGPAVEISTMHKAKGREWPVVFVCGVTDGLLPHKKAEDVEEERRLLYISITRAKHVCFVSPGGEPSPFFGDLQRALFMEDEKLPPLPPGEVKSEGFDCQLEVLREIMTQQEELLDRAGRMPLPPLEDRLRELRARISDAMPAAEAAARKEVVAGEPGSRFVAITTQAMEALLTPVGFWEAPRSVSKKANQRVFEGGLPGRGVGYDLLIRIYSTIPVGDVVVRDLGEDSIKIVACRWNMDGEETPLHRKLPYAMRTRGWRATLLRKIEEVLEIIESREGLKK